MIFGALLGLAIGSGSFSERTPVKPLVEGQHELFTKGQEFGKAVVDSVGVVVGLLLGGAIGGLAGGGLGAALAVYLGQESTPKTTVKPALPKSDPDHLAKK
jgi:hypothetical protein